MPESSITHIYVLGTLSELVYAALLLNEIAYLEVRMYVDTIVFCSFLTYSSPFSSCNQWDFNPCLLCDSHQIYQPLPDVKQSKF